MTVRPAPMRRALAPSGVLAVTVGLAAATMAPVQAATTGPRESVLVQLSPRDPAGLSALAAARGITETQRAAGLAAAAPGSARVARVEALLRAAGLRVDATSAWSVTASGPAASVVAAFGSARGTGALHATDPRLAALVTTVVGGDQPALHLRSYGTITPRLTLAPHASGGSLRSAYGQTSNGTPLTGRPNLTVATVQLSDWDSSELSYYAANVEHLATDPRTDGTYTAITVGAGAVFDPNGSGEVALDQETLLAVAPKVHQRAYFAPNDDTGVGFIAAVEQIATDAAVSANHIAAFSTSWGACETDWPSSARAAMHTALAHVSAAGVTMFAATGDFGTADCRTGGTGVDFPGSDPLVVAVGGTTLNVGPPLTETAWDCRSPSGSCGGGGYSVEFARPSWQAATQPSPHRTLPDIAATADPYADGVDLYHNGGVGIGGGTSLSAPLSAGLLTDTLAARGLSAGVGDIHPSLYAAPSTAFRDITSGNIDPALRTAYSAHAGYDLASGRGAPRWNVLGPWLLAPQLQLPYATRATSVALRVVTPAAASYSATKWAVGLGSSAPACTSASAGSLPASIATPTVGRVTVHVSGLSQADNGCYAATAVVIVDRAAPTVPAVSARQTSGAVSSITASWSASDALSGVYAYTWSVTHDGATTVDAHGVTAARGVTLALPPGRTYRVHVSASDRAGNVSAVRTFGVVLPVDDSAFSLSRGWTRVAATGAYRASWLRTSTRGATATYVAPTAVRITVEAVRCAGCGMIAVYLDGRLVRVVDLYAAATGYHVPVLTMSMRTGRHAVVVRALGTRSARSQGVIAGVDGLLVLR